MMECGSRKSILIVEDDDDVRGALATFLEAEGYNVREAREGAAALRELREGGVGLILLDLWMPGMNGWEFRAEQVKDATLAHVPVVVITADQGAATRATALGVSGCMTKPIEFPALLDYVARYC